MKKKYFLLFCLSAFFICASAQQFNFFKYIPISGTVFNNVNTCLDAGYLLSGGTDGANGGNYVLVKTDSDGNVLWTNVGTRFTGMPGNGSNLIVKSIQALDDSYYLGGNITTNTGTQIYFVKLDSLHNLEWDTIVSNLSRHTELTDMLLLNDSILIFTGMLCDSGAYCNFLIGEFNTISKQITNFNTFDFGNADEALNIFYSNNSFTLSGSSYDVNQPDSNKVVGLKVDTSFIEIWRFDSVFVHSSTGKSVFDFCNKELYISSATFNPSGNSFIVVLDSLGSYSRTIVADTSNLLTAIALDSNANIVFSNGRLGFRKYESGTGNLLWSLDTSATIIYSQNVFQVMRDKKGDFVFCGYEREAGHPPASYMGKILDGSGNSVNELSFSSSFLIYPNPVVTNLTVFSMQYRKPFSFDLFSLSGTALIHSVINKSVTTFDLSSINPGIYLYKISDNQTSQAPQYGKIIKL